jgi:uncharacterized membrane protein
MNAAPDKTVPQRRPLVMAGAGLLAAAGVVAAIAVSPYDLYAAAARADFAPHGPDLALLMRQSPAVLVHMFSALAAFAIGVVILMRPKGRGLHKLLGWSWVIAMTVAAAGSFFITGLNGDGYSLIHLLSGWTVIMLPMAILAIRRRDVNAHRRRMTGLFTGGLVVAGLFTFLPGRLMWNLFLG